MKQLLTRGSVLARTEYGEADRILTVLTPDYGKLRLMARGVRRPKSKLAAGIELFSISDISFIRGRGEIGTLVSTRLIKHHDRIVHELDRVRLGYELLKMLNRATEDQPESEYFTLLEQALTALNNHDLDLALIRLWFGAQLLRQAGHQPNLHTTADNDKLQAGQRYNFDFEAVSFTPHETGTYSTDDIKFLRLLFSGNQPLVLAHVENSTDLTSTCSPLVQTMLQTYIRI